MKKIIILIILLTTLNSYSQSYYDVLQNFIAKSPQLKELNANLTADSLSLRQGLNPLDPTLEFEYYFDNKFEISIKQQFDFPTLCHQRNMIAKNGINKNQLEYRVRLRELLLQVSDLYQQFVYYNNMVEVMIKRKESMANLNEIVETATKKGNMTILESKKISVLYKTATIELINANRELKTVNVKLKQLGITLNNNANFEQFNFNGSKEDFVNVIMQGDVGLEILKTDSIVAKHKLKLARQEWIPKFDVGYKADFGAGELRHGIVAGISIPLWQHRNNVKYNKANVKAQNAQMENQMSMIKVELETLFENYDAAKQNVQAWQVEQFNNYEELIRKSIQSNNITAMEYLLELNDWQNVQIQMIEDDYDLAKYGAQMAVYFCFN